uniref:Sorting nexin-12 n=1 Tax=Talaromyces marneffei PM1 TaxID=1077442 RepID=A0A093XHN9_TALMA
MALSQRHLLLAGFSGFVSWGLVVNWVPFARYLGWAFVAGVLVTFKTKSEYIERRTTVPNLRFLAADAWSEEVSNYRKATEYEPKSLYPQSFVVSEAIDELLQLASRDFIRSWYGHISKNLAFINEIDRALRIALESIRDRLSSEDVTSLVVSRIVPILTTHLKDFDRAERAIRGRNLARSVTESEELGLAIASKYRDGRLHPAVAVSLADQKTIQQDYVRKLVMGLLPQLLPDNLLTSRAVSVLIREIVACAVLLPVITLLSDPDTWNQILETYGRTALNDRKTVKKLRAALDKHASPSKPKGSPSFPRLGPNDSERAFERFVRAIRRCNNLSDARQFRAQVASQLKRESMVEGQDQVYIRRLETGKRVLDQKVSKLAANASIRRPAAPSKPEFRRDSVPNHKDVSLVDLMRNASGLSYFMEFMDRQNKMSLVQFWIVVDGFRNPLEDDFGDESSTSSAAWTSADVSDMVLINENYLSKPELNVLEESRDAVKAFLKAGKRASPEQYRKARTAILMTQSTILEEMESKYYPKFRDSDLFYKYLASDETSLAATEQEAPLRASTPEPQHRERRPLPPLMTRTQSQPSMQKPKDLRRAAVSNDVQSNGKLFDDVESSPRRSVDSDRSARLFDDDYDTDPLSYSFSMSSQNGDAEAKNTEVIENMEQALNEIIVDQPNGKSEDPRLFSAVSSSSLFPDAEQSESRSSLDTSRNDVRLGERNKPSISSLGLIGNPSRTGVFEDELFPDEKKFIEDEYADPEGDEKDPEDEIHQAAPGDLGLTEAIVALTEEIEKLNAQESVLDTLTRKAELTNNTAELRILSKSKASIQREIRRKEMQRQQYVIQESDNSLYGRSTIHIPSIMVGKEEDGNEFAIYVIEVRRNAGEQMPAASWAVPRRYSEFHELHQKLRMRYPSVRQLEFPRRRMMMKLQKDFLQKRRVALETYLQQLLLLPEVCRSRDLRAFLSQQALLPHGAPASDGETKDIVSRIYNSVADGMDDFLGNITMLDQLSTAGQNLISAATSQLTGPEPALATEDAMTAAEAEAELNAFEDRELEPFIKPICDLFLEAFELNRGNNWLRGRAVVVVLHQLLGGTIERKVRDSAKSLVEDDNLLRYMTLAKATMWPGGVMRKPVVRTSSQKSKSKNEASFMMAALIPDLAGNVVGRANAQSASRKIYDILNNPHLNAHLVFTILDEIVLVLFGGTDPGRSRQQSIA